MGCELEPKKPVFKANEKISPFTTQDTTTTRLEAVWPGGGTESIDVIERLIDGKREVYVRVEEGIFQVERIEEE